MGAKMEVRSIKAGETYVGGNTYNPRRKTVLGFVEWAMLSPKEQREMQLCNMSAEPCCSEYVRYRDQGGHALIRA